MDRLNLTASIQNLAHVDKLQAREVHNPINASIANSVVDQDRFDELQVQPTEVNPEQTVDPDEKRKQEKKQKKKPDGKNRGKKSGKFIDYSA